MSMYGNGTRRPVIETGEGLTKQSMKDECDINRIMANAQRTGMIAHVTGQMGQYVDVSAVTDFREALEQVRKASEFFDGLPAKVRAFFDNDPAKYLDSAGALTKEELVELGLEVLEEEPKKAAAPEGAAAGT